MINNRLFKSRKLGKSTEFKQAFRLGKKISQGCLTSYTMPNDYKYARFGLSVAKKTVSSATTRNWIKRTVRESFRLKQKILPNLDIVIVIRYYCLNNKQSLLYDLDKQWSKLMIYYKRY